MWFGVALILYGISMFVWWGVLQGAGRLLLIALVRRKGRSAVGVVGPGKSHVVKVPTSFGSVVRTSRSVDVTECLIAFTTAEGRVITFWVHEDDLRKVRTDTCEVRYLAGHPRVHVLATASLSSAWAGTALGLLYGGSATFFGAMILAMSR